MIFEDRARAGDIGARLAAICGDRFTRPAGAADDVAGRPARWVAAPGTPEAVGAVLRVAGDHGLSVVPRGAGTKIDWGATPAQLDIVLDTGRLAGVRRRPAGELTAEIGAGTPLRAVQAILERSGLRLSIDAPSAGATLGGVLAADEAGPLRHRDGPPCRQLVGVSYVDASGVLTHAESRATDPSPGGDLAGLLCGSHGALAVLVSATVRVQPLPAARLWVTRPVWTPLEVHDLVRAVLATDLSVAAIEVDLPALGPVGTPSRARPGSRGPGSLALLVEGGPAEVSERATRLGLLLGGDVRTSATPPAWWRSYPFGPDDVALRVEVPITDLYAAVYALRDAAGGPVPVRGSAGLGVVHVALPGSTPPDRVTDILTAVRTVLLARDGRCVVLAAPPAVRAAVDLWGDLPDLPLLRRVKERFDPAHRLAPGRFAGGL
ncbi:FAD-binding oxidoreductase [Micromonospora zhanjiangensis]|uniref:FAD-binding oxidoreductase n=1 Tax=Micromonospora zhanjiangensis TaxID=1522057 RepID=A0ABV8KS08_9ACTN